MIDYEQLPPVPPGNDHAAIRRCVLAHVIPLGVHTYLEVFHDPTCASAADCDQPCDCGPTIYAGIGPARRCIVAEGQLVEASSAQ